MKRSDQSAPVIELGSATGETKGSIGKYVDFALTQAQPTLGDD